MYKMNRQIIFIETQIISDKNKVQNTSTSILMYMYCDRDRKFDLAMFESQECRYNIQLQIKQLNHLITVWLGCL